MVRSIRAGAVFAESRRPAGCTRFRVAVAMIALRVYHPVRNVISYVLADIKLSSLGPRVKWAVFVGLFDHFPLITGVSQEILISDPNLVVTTLEISFSLTDPNFAAPSRMSG